MAIPRPSWSAASGITRRAAPRPKPPVFSASRPPRSLRRRDDRITLSSTAGAAALVNYVAYQVEMSRARVHYTWRDLFVVNPGDTALLVSNIVIDVSLLAVSRWYLQVASRRTRAMVVLDLLVPLSFAIVAVYLAILSGASLAAMSSPHPFIAELGTYFNRFAYWFESAHGHDTNSTIAMRLFFGPAAFSSFVFLSVIATASLIYGSRRLTQRPLSAVLRWLTTRRTNLLALATGFVGAVAMLVGQFQS